MAGGKGFTSQTFTSSGTWTAPAGVTQVILIGSGGGAGGSGGVKYFLREIPGGNGVVQSTRIVPVVPNTTYTITIGAGGTGASGSAATGPIPVGGTGGNTTFGVLATFYGATGGLAYNDPNTGVNRYASGYALDPQSFYQTAIFGCNFASGTPGALSSNGGQPYTGGGGGGAGANGPGGNGGNGNYAGAGAAGSTATSYGGGGGGGGCGSSTGGPGGNGGPGFLQVIWVEA